MTTIIYLAVNDQHLAVASQPTVASGGVNTVSLKVNFSENWDSYAKSAVFFTEKDETPYEKVLNSNGECLVPQEVLAEAGILYIGIRGVYSKTSQVRTTTLVKYKIKEGAPQGSGTAVSPTPSVYQQLLTNYAGINARIDTLITGDSLPNTKHDLVLNNYDRVSASTCYIETNGSCAVIVINQLLIQKAGNFELFSIPEEFAPLERIYTTIGSVKIWYENGSLWAQELEPVLDDTNFTNINLPYSLKQAFTPSELADIRVGVDGFVYESAGEAVRQQISQVKNQTPTGGGGGMSSTASALLISILENAVYTNDQSAVITALETALRTSGSGGSDTPDVPLDPDKTYYSVFVTQTNCTVDSSARNIEEGGVYVAQITPNEGYTLETVTVTMGGKDVTSTAYSNGSISISNVTGIIVIVANAVETPNDLVYSANWNYGKRQYSATASQANASWTSSDWIDVTAGQILTASLLESVEFDGTVYNWDKGNMSLELSFRDSSGQSVAFNYTNVMSLNEGDAYPSIQEIIVPDGAVSMCLCVASKKSYDGFNAEYNSSNYDGRPVFWQLLLSNGGAI